MKFAKVAALAAAFFLIAGAQSLPARADVSFDFFYSNLSPHGRWVVSAEYGHCWQPSAYEVGWNPYYDGHWVYTDLGWTWVSDYEWGSIPYHYGTWVLDSRVGWVWVPGYVWAPSWVVFRTGPDYIGWAPVSPRFSVGVSVGYIEPAAFVFVSSHDFVAPRLRSCIVPESRTTVIINRTRIVNNIAIEKNVVVNRGPDVRFIERASGHRLARVPIERVQRVAPGPRVTRQEFFIDPGKARHGLRAAEPIPGREPLPLARERRQPGREGRLDEERSVRPNLPAPGREKDDTKQGRRRRDIEPPRQRPTRPAADEHMSERPQRAAEEETLRRKPQRAAEDETLRRTPQRPADTELRRHRSPADQGGRPERMNPRDSERRPRAAPSPRRPSRPQPPARPSKPGLDSDKDGAKKG